LVTHSIHESTKNWNQKYEMPTSIEYISPETETCPILVLP
jgi:hypothetical protein